MVTEHKLVYFTRTKCWLPSRSGFQRLPFWLHVWLYKWACFISHH